MIFVKDDITAIHMGVTTSDLGQYVGSTQINSIETVLNVGNNPTTGGAVTGTARTGATLTAAAIGDLDDINGKCYLEWQSNDSASDAATNASSDTTWSCSRFSCYKHWRIYYLYATRSKHLVI